MTGAKLYNFNNNYLYYLKNGDNKVHIVYHDDVSSIELQSGGEYIYNNGKEKVGVIFSGIEDDKYIFSTINDGIEFSLTTGAIKNGHIMRKGFYKGFDDMDLVIRESGYNKNGKYFQKSIYFKSNGDIIYDKFDNV